MLSEKMSFSSSRTTSGRETLAVMKTNCFPLPISTGWQRRVCDSHRHTLLRPICSASRASILTGKSTARLRFEFVTKDAATFQPVNERLRAPRYTLNLPLKETTIAEMLASSGYQTAFFGKWHLNRHHQRYLGWSPTHGPVTQGFSVAAEDFGSHPYSYWRDKSKRTFLEIPKGRISGRLDDLSVPLSF